MRRMTWDTWLAAIALGAGLAGLVRLDPAAPAGVLAAVLTGGGGGYIASGLLRFWGDRRRRPRLMRPDTPMADHLYCGTCLHFRRREGHVGDCHLIGNPPVVAFGVCEQHLERIGS